MCATQHSYERSFKIMLCRWTRLCVALCIALFAVGAFAQFQTGNIYGRVQAKDGSALPGVTVTLTGVGAPQSTITDAQGNFRFANLSPGTYGLKAELGGFGSTSRTGVGVLDGANADATKTPNPSGPEPSAGRMISKVPADTSTRREVCRPRRLCPPKRRPIYSTRTKSISCVTTASSSAARFGRTICGCGLQMLRTRSAM